MRDDQAPVLEALRSPETYPHPTGEIRTIETHISFVYLTGRVAYKIKKAVKLPYVDFSTLQRRERACRDELALNRRLAPALYQEVVSIGSRPEGIRIGAEPAMEFAVRMTQFPDADVADALIGGDRLAASELAELGGVIARFHLALRAAAGSPVRDRILKNLEEIESELVGDRRVQVETIAKWVRQALDRTADALEQRAATQVRECHGDLHLGNIVRFDGKLIPFDCLEFSRDLRTIDVIDEVAFLFMDLAAHGRIDLAYAFLNAYLEVTGDYAGLRLLRPYTAHRALVRAKVALAAPDRDALSGRSRATAYLEAAAGNARESCPFLVVTAGYSGSGKTTIARRLAPCFGAVHIRADVERKRLQDLAPDARTDSGIEQGIYRPEITRETYGRLADAAESAVRGGIDIIVDASFLDRDERDRFRELASRLGAHFVILHCAARTETLRERIVARSRAGKDASEADLAVLEHQLTTAAPFGDVEQGCVHTVDTDDDIDPTELAHAIRASLDQSSSSTSY